jgi:hypothetical protein
MRDSPPSAPSEVPPPVLAASRERLRLLPPERVPLWAAYWIAGGHDGDALRYLAGLHGDDPREVHDALPQALMVCGAEMPDSDVAAAAVLFTHIARLHVEGLAGQGPGKVGICPGLSQQLRWPRSEVIGSSRVV